MTLRSILRRLQSASTGVWLVWRKSERLSLIVSRTNIFNNSAFEDDPFSVRTPKRRHLKTILIPLLTYALDYNGIQSYDLRLLTAINKRLCFARGLATPFYWINVNAYRFHSVSIRKRSNVNGQRFHRGGKKVFLSGNLRSRLKNFYKILQVAQISNYWSNTHMLSIVVLNVRKWNKLWNQSTRIRLLHCGLDFNSENRAKSLVFDFKMVHSSFKQNQMCFGRLIYT